MSRFLERLVNGPCLLFDGGFGTELIARGLPPGTPPDQWTLDHPEQIVAVHTSYVNAGSEAVHANTFGANAARLAVYGLADRLVDINRTAIRLARESGARFVLADVGPTGEYLPPVGRGDAGAWRQHFQEQGRILGEAGIDGFHIETMSDVREAVVALESLREVAPAIPVLVSMTFERKKRGFFTIMGDAPRPSMTRLWEAGAAAVGANCSLASRDMVDLAQEVLSTARAPFLLQPNAGTPELIAGRSRYAQDPDEFARDLASLLTDPHVAALGGCCGTDPRFIAALRARMRSGSRP